MKNMMKRRKRQPNPNDSFLAHNPGPAPDLNVEAPDTPERRAEMEELTRQARDPSTPLGAFFKMLAESPTTSKD